MKSYHIAWLLAHPHRTSAWLAERLADGFDVHHVDGNHGNDDPSNLVLMEHVDHMAMHGMTGLGRLSPKGHSKPRRKRKHGGTAKGREYFNAMVALRDTL